MDDITRPVPVPLNRAERLRTAAVKLRAAASCLDDAVANEKLTTPIVIAVQLAGRAVADASLEIPL